MAVALAGAWVAIVLAGAWQLRPAPARARALVGPAVGRGARRSPAVVVGKVLLGWRGRRVDPLAARRLGRAVLVAVPLAPMAPLMAVPVGLVAWGAPALGARRARRRHEAAVLGSLPEVVDLFVLAVGAGLTVPLAVVAVARRAPGPLAAELARVVDEVGLGRRLADALDDIPGRLGEPTRPLVGALAASERYGAPLLASLDRLAVEVRADRRRRTEEAARRVPVKLLFPLVFCTLPAFALLTVAPLLAGALSALRL